MERYEDNFPKIVFVKWNNDISIEFVIHPEIDEFLMEGLKFLCPKCNFELTEPYDPIGNNFCPSCGMELWTSQGTFPLVKEPEEIKNIIQTLKNNYYSCGEMLSVNNFRVKKTNSKFYSLERINWGASPGARKTVLGEYFTKMRLYRIDQPIVAQYLTLLRKSKNLTIQDIVDKLPQEYQHTVGHWFRKDFGGSIPIPEDIELLKRIFNVENGLLEILQRTALKFQTVKSSIKGKNPGDYIKEENEENLVEFLKLLYMPHKEDLN